MPPAPLSSRNGPPVLDPLLRGARDALMCAGAWRQIRSVVLLGAMERRCRVAAAAWAPSAEDLVTMEQLADTSDAADEDALGLDAHAARRRDGHPLAQARAGLERAVELAEYHDQTRAAAELSPEALGLALRLPGPLGPGLVAAVLAREPERPDGAAGALDEQLFARLADVGAADLDRIDRAMAARVRAYFQGDPHAPFSYGLREALETGRLDHTSAVWRAVREAWDARLTPEIRQEGQDAGRGGTPRELSSRLADLDHLALLLASPPRVAPRLVADLWQVCATARRGGLASSTWGLVRSRLLAQPGLSETAVRDAMATLAGFRATDVQPILANPRVQHDARLAADLLATVPASQLPVLASADTMATMAGSEAVRTAWFDRLCARPGPSTAQEAEATHKALLFSLQHLLDAGLRLPPAVRAAVLASPSREVRVRALQVLGGATPEQG